MKGAALGRRWLAAVTFPDGLAFWMTARGESAEEAAAEVFASFLARDLGAPTELRGVPLMVRVAQLAGGAS